MKQPTLYTRVLAVLEEGPSTSGEIAAETGIPMRKASACLSYLASKGTVVRQSRAPKEPACHCCGRMIQGKAPYIYALKEQGAVCDTP